MMSDQKRLRLVGMLALGLSIFATSCASVSAQLANVEQQVITFVNGLSFEGKIVYVPELGTTFEQISHGDTGSQIMLVDDGLRRIFLRKRRDDVNSVSPVVNPHRELTINQPGVDSSGSTASTIGQIYQISPFDQWGRRTITIQTAKGPAEFTQGITLITPTYCEVETLRDNIPNTPKKQWKMNISTKSVPVEVIRKILLRQIDAKNFDDRLSIVEFLTRAQRYKQARIELAEIAREFPGLEEQLMDQYRLMLQAEADQSLREIRAWQTSGNAELALGLLDQLKTKTRLSSETLAEINDIRQSISDESQAIESAKASVLKIVEAVSDGDDADPEAVQIATWLKEDIEKNINAYNRERLASFLRLENDESLSIDKKLALAVSGWIIGSRAATDNLAVAISLTQAKPLVEKYLSPAPSVERAGILKQLSELEAGDPLYVSLIVKYMAPPVATDFSGARGPEPMKIEFEIPKPGGGTQPATCMVQLPPNYNPYRNYPCVVSLSGVNTNPSAQIAWWTGDYRPNLAMRRGFAARNGYIVIAPQWLRPGQLKYEYSAIEHVRVLGALRTAMRRFSIDSDRVFLSGHFQGGDAAWDIGLAHPEHWAGVIPISADARKYVRHYKNNARYVPLYFVHGERDMTARELNSETWNRYLKGREHDAFVIQYKGRGAEDFYEEIGDIFRWMNVKRRDPDEMKSFECSTMRSNDNYFWWYEVHGIKPAKVVHPELWDLTKRKSDLLVSAQVDNNRIRYDGEDGNATIWLMPSMVNFTEKIRIGERFNEAVQPSTKVLLEDVRQRADRQHPYWARVDMINNRWQIID